MRRHVRKILNLRRQNVKEKVDTVGYRVSIDMGSVTTCTVGNSSPVVREYSLRHRRVTNCEFATGDRMKSGNDRNNNALVAYKNLIFYEITDRNKYGVDVNQR